jgi:hypothetical protein
MTEQIDLAKIPFPVVLTHHYRDRATGSLTVTSGSLQKRVFLDKGAVVFAASNDLNDRLGEMLLRRGVLKLGDFLAASNAIVPGKRFGTILVEQGVFTPGQLVWAVKEQVKEIVFSLFGLPSGNCSFAVGADAGDEMITLAINTPELLRQGVARMDNVIWSLDALRQPRTKLRLKRSVEKAMEPFTLSDAETSLLSSLSQPRRLEEICQTTQISHFPLLKFLWALLILDYIQTLPEAEGSSSPGPAEALPELEVTGEDLESLT